MLGRTDSRARALLVLIGFVLVAGSLGVRLAYWQVAPSRRAGRDGGPAVVDALRDPVDAGLDLRPDGHGGPRDERRPRPAGGLPQAPHPGAPRGRRRAARRRSSASRATPPPSSRRAWSRSASTWSSRATSTRPSPTRSAPRAPATTPTLVGAPARARARPRLPAAGRRPATPRSPPTCSASSTATAPGQYGVEQYYQDQLAGMPRVVAAQKDAAGNPVPDSSTVLDAGYPGQDLTLTLDASLQVAVEQELLAAWIADRAKRVSAVVMDPYTRRGRRLRELPLVRRQRLPGDRRDDARSGSSTRSCRRSTSPGRCSRC